LVRNQGVLCVARAGRLDGASMEVSKVELGRILNCWLAGKMFPAVMVLQAVWGFFDSVTFQELSFRAERGICCARSVKERDSSLREE